ncbi:cupin domain-containing protein [Halobacillus litoralis]|uniref:cupin domain-containing protein n=1 Tax=Halobacillus litoralis TaxID=45668 RepID=UPI003D7DA662
MNEEFHWNEHEDCDEIFYVLEGELFIELENNKTISLKQGEIFTVPANTMHRTRSIKLTFNLCVEKASNNIRGGNR